MSDPNVLKELVQKASAGDNTAFEQLYKETCRSVYFTCFEILKDEQEAQDITQDVYLTVYEQLRTLEDADRFKSWLYRIAANKSINCLKRKHPLLPGDEKFEDMEVEENESFLPEEYALNADKRALVLDITRKVCTDAQYQTILLYYFNEFSIAEIAEIMECQENNVKKRLSIARTKIREGVLRYEKKNDDKLYAIAILPFFTALLTAQMQDMQIPSFSFSFPDVLPESTHAAQTTKSGRLVMFKSIQFKIAVGVAAAVITVGSIAAAVIINNKSTEAVSVGALGESTPDIAGLENSADAETSPETNTGETHSDEDASQEVSDTAIGAESLTIPETAKGAASGETKTTGQNTSTEGDETAEDSSETTPEQTAAAEQEYTYTDMNATKYAAQTVNVRNLPDTSGDRVGGLAMNDEVTVTGQCNETGWYRFEYNGSTAYVSNQYLSDTMIETAAAEPAANSEAAAQSESAAQSSSSNNNASTVSNSRQAVLDELIQKCGLYTWNDYGDWFVYVCTSPSEKPPSECQDIWDILHERYFDGVSTLYIAYTSNEGLYFDENVYVWFACLSNPKPQGLKDFIYQYGAPGAINNHYYGLWLDD